MDKLLSARGFSDLSTVCLRFCHRYRVRWVEAGRGRGGGPCGGEPPPCHHFHEPSPRDIAPNLPGDESAGGIRGRHGPLSMLTPGNTTGLYGYSSVQYPQSPIPSQTNNWGVVSVVLGPTRRCGSARAAQRRSCEQSALGTWSSLSVYRCVAAGVKPKTTARERCDGARVRRNPSYPLPLGHCWDGQQA